MLLGTVRQGSVVQPPSYRYHYEQEQSVLPLPALGSVIFQCLDLSQPLLLHLQRHPLGIELRVNALPRRQGIGVLSYDSRQQGCHEDTGAGRILMLKLWSASLDILQSRSSLVFREAPPALPAGVMGSATSICDARGSAAIAVACRGLQHRVDEDGCLRDVDDTQQIQCVFRVERLLNEGKKPTSKLQLSQDFDCALDARQRPSGQFEEPHRSRSPRHRLSACSSGI